MPLAGAQERSRHETRSGILEFEANGYPTDDTVRRIQKEIDYQRAVQAYIHFVPAVGMMQWRNAHFDSLGGKTGDLIVYRTTHALIREMPRAGRSSQSPGLQINADGSVDLFFGPKALPVSPDGLPFRPAISGSRSRLPCLMNRRSGGI